MPMPGQRVAPLGWIVASEGHGFMPVCMAPGRIVVLGEGLPLHLLVALETAPANEDLVEYRGT
jgi:hypothetical protein